MGGVVSIKQSQEEAKENKTIYVQIKLPYR